MIAGRLAGRRVGGAAAGPDRKTRRSLGEPLAWCGLFWLLAQPLDASCTPPVEAPVAIDLFERTLAGSYRLARIESSGRAHYLQFQRRIQQAREGELPSEALEALLGLVRSAGFAELRERYDLEPAAGAPERVYEDIYYRLRIDTGGESRLVVAHQHAAPPILREVVTTALRGLRALPRRTVTGPQLLVVEAEIARQIRWVEPVGPAPISLEEVPRDSFLPLRRAVATPGRPEALPPGGEPGIRERLNRERTCVDLVDGGRRLAACVLGVESDRRHDSRR